MTGAPDQPRGQVVLYQDPEGGIELRVRLVRDSIWLSQKELSLLFDRDSDTIGLHLRNIFEEGELDEAATSEESSVVQTEGGRQVRRNVLLYSFDAIISVGYRVNSKRGTQFRIWATQVLRQHSLAGYSVNQSRLRELHQTVRLVAGVIDRRDLSGDEAKALLRVLGEYGRALDLLDDYDHQRIHAPDVTSEVVRILTYEEALRIVGQLRERFGESTVFGIEKDKGLASALGAVMQSFDGQDRRTTGRREQREAILVSAAAFGLSCDSLFIGNTVRVFE